MSEDNIEFSFFCQYDDCGSRAPNIHELRVAIVSVEVPSDNDLAEEGFVRYSTIYGTTDLTTPACSVQGNFRVKYVSTGTECVLLIGDEGIWSAAIDLLTGQNITPLPPWSEEDRKLFDEVYDYETQFLRYSHGDADATADTTKADPYVTLHDLAKDAALQKLDTGSGTSHQYFTPNFAFSCLYEYSSYWPLSTSFIAPQASDDSGADDDGSVTYYLRTGDASGEKRRLTPSPLTRKKQHSEA